MTHDQLQLCAHHPSPGWESVWRGERAPLYWTTKVSKSAPASPDEVTAGLAFTSGLQLALIQCDESRSKEKPKMEKSKAISSSAFPLKTLSKIKTFL